MVKHAVDKQCFPVKRVVENLSCNCSEHVSVDF